MRQVRGAPLVTRTPDGKAVVSLVRRSI